MLKVKIEEKYLKSFEWLLQCYQYLFYYDSGAEVSYNAFRTHQEPYSPHVSRNLVSDIYREFRHLSRILDSNRREEWNRWLLIIAVDW